MINIEQNQGENISYSPQQQQQQQHQKIGRKKKVGS
jgi:hypothetical protein